MLETSPLSRSHGRMRAARRAWVARGAALMAAGFLMLSTALPASALGEDGPFPLPVETDSISLVPGAVTSVPLVALLEDELQGDLELGSAQLAVPEDLSAAEQERMELGEDGRTLAVAGEGTWSLLDEELVFTPAGGLEGDPTPIALTIGGDQGSRSQPAVFEATQLELEETPLHGSAGESIATALETGVPGSGSVRLQLDGLPAGSTVVDDGSRVVVPDQGVWQLSADGSSLTHTPSGPGPGHQPDPIRYLVLDGEGAPLHAGRVTVSVPIISDLYRSAPFGQDIVFAVGEGQQNVDPSTLRLEPLPGGEDAEISEDGTEVTVPGQGVWTLDRDSATVEFSPQDSDVRRTAPMGITGGDGEGATATPALLDTAYPVLIDRQQAATPGSEVQFDLTTGARDVRTDSLRFDRDRLPDGAELSEDGTEVRVPGEGVWQIDLEARTVTMRPAEDFSGTASPVGLAANGVHADNPVGATLEATFASDIATLRDDEERTAPGTPITVDVLGNDTAGSGSQPLVPESVQIRSMSATNLTGLEEGRGTRLVIPGQGTFTVEDNGAISFAPEEGFVGSTTAIEYLVLDERSIPTSASLTVEVDPALEESAASRTESSGINSLLVGVMPSSPSTATVFGTIVTLLLFGGGVSLWIGNRMEADRRVWQD